MKVVLAYLRLYGDCMAKAFEGLKRNAWTLLLPMALWPALKLAGGLLAPLGFAAGIAYVLVQAAAISCYLYFVGEVVEHSRVSIREFRTSIGAYFWSVLNLGFVLWIVELVLGMAVGQHPRAEMISFAVTLLELVLLNPAPEVIYVRGTRNGLETIQRSIRFIQDNWIEWFIPNLLLIGAGWWFLQNVVSRLGPLALVGLVGLGALLHVLMVFRGHLFRVLDGSTHRQRMFRYRTAGLTD